MTQEMAEVAAYARWSEENPPVEPRNGEAFRAWLGAIDWMRESASYEAAIAEWFGPDWDKRVPSHGDTFRFAWARALRAALEQVEGDKGAR